MKMGFIILLSLLIALVVLAIKKGDGKLRRGLRLATEQFVIVVPKVIVALTAASFIAQLIPSNTISEYLGADAGVTAIFIAALVGMCTPAGAVIIFAVAAVLAQAGADVPALISFVVGWSLFSVQRMIIYEASMIGLSYIRIKVASVFAIPFIAGLLAIGVKNIGIIPALP